MICTIYENDLMCPVCNIGLEYYDKVKRILKAEDGNTEWVTVSRFRCTNCGHIHRALPKDIVPYKHYRREIIMDVINGLITTDTIGYEDYPCEMTMLRWKAQKLQLLL